MKKHIHHIIPKHMGGTNSPENLIELTVEEHAEAHRKLYEQYGHWQDHVAWKSLSGQITTDEARRLAAILAWTGRKHTEETKNKIKEARNKQKVTDNTRKKISESLKGRKITWNTNSTTKEANEKRSKTMSGIAKPKVKCPHCNKEGGGPQMKQWHFDNCKKKRALKCV